MGPIMPIFGIRARRAGDGLPGPVSRLAMPMRSQRPRRQAESLVQIPKLPGDAAIE